MPALYSKKPKKMKKQLLAPDIEKRHPEISFKYLYKCDKGCFKELYKISRKNNTLDYFDDLQRFLYESSQFESVSDMISNYTSKNGSKISASESSFVKSITNSFKINHPNDEGLIKDAIIHIHLKKNGKGKFVMFGANKDNVFYVLAFDPEHTFNKK